MKFELNSDLKEPEMSLILTMININTFEPLIPEKILNEGWWSASAIVKFKEINVGISNVNHYANNLINQEIIQKKKIQYVDAGRRKRHRVMFRLNPKAKGKIFSIIQQKQLNIFLNKNEITKKFAPMLILGKHYFNQGKGHHKWLLKSTEDEIVQLKKVKESIEQMILSKKDIQQILKYEENNKE